MDLEECFNSAVTSSNLSTSISQKQFQVTSVLLYGVPIVSLIIESQERLCLAQISNTLLKTFSYNEIHNRRVALGITCVQCTPVQLEILRRSGAMPVSSRRCGMITRREAERLCKSFLSDNSPPRLPEDFTFTVHHECAWGCRGSFIPSRYNSSRAKCIKCHTCSLFFSPNKFIFHSHRTGSNATYVQPDAANYNSWRRHMKLIGKPSEAVVHAWEDVKAMFNGGTRKRLISTSASIMALRNPISSTSSEKAASMENDNGNTSPTSIDLVYPKQLHLNPYININSSTATTTTSLPWLKRAPLFFTNDSFFLKNYTYDSSAFMPIYPITSTPENLSLNSTDLKKQNLINFEDQEDDVDIESTDDKDYRLPSGDKNINFLVKTHVDDYNRLDNFWNFPKFSFQYAAAAAAAATMSAATNPHKRLIDSNAATSSSTYLHDDKTHFICSKPLLNANLLQSIKINDECNVCQTEINQLN